MADLRIRSDQWDVRLNVPNDIVNQSVLNIVKDYYESGKVRYCHVSGVEVGDVPGRTSYGERHVHIALVLYNYTSRGAIIKKLVPAAKDKSRKLFVQSIPVQ